MAPASHALAGAVPGALCTLPDKGKCMSMKWMIPCAALLACFSLEQGRAQEKTAPPAETVATPSVAAEAAGPVAVTDQLLPSDWIRYSQPVCCGPVGGDGPIKSELYVRTGPNFVMGGGYFPAHLNPVGMTFEAGGRSLFFNEPRDHAWVIDLGISFIGHSCGSTDPVVLNVFLIDDGVQRDVDATVKRLLRTYVNLALGQEWYPWAPACAPGKKWRFGTDAGVRFGTCRVDFNEIEPLSRNMWAAFVAAHTDLEIPCGSNCVFLTGLRVEWGYTWNTVLQSFNNADIADLAVMLTAGVRF